MQSIGSKSVLIAFCVSNRSMAQVLVTGFRQICTPIVLALVLTLALSVSPTSLLAQAPASSSTASQKPAPSSANTRVEKDLLGEKQIPADAYYGVQTARALENFQLSGVPINHYPGFRRSLGHRQAGSGARQHRRRRDEEGAARRDREGQPGSARWKVPRSVHRRLVSGRRRNLHQHERQ